MAKENKKVIQNAPGALDAQPGSKKELGLIQTEVKNAVQTIFESVVGLEDFGNIMDDLATKIITDLANKNFFTEQLELTEKQKEALRSALPSIKDRAKNEYIENIDTDKRRKAIAAIVKREATNLAERVLSAVGQEVNRGACINASCVVMDAKNPDYNQMTLRASKMSGDMTTPCSVLVIATNTIDFIKNNISIKGF